MATMAGNGENEITCSFDLGTLVENSHPFSTFDLTFIYVCWRVLNLSRRDGISSFHAVFCRCILCSINSWNEGLFFFFFFLGGGGGGGERTDRSCYSFSAYDFITCLYNDTKPTSGQSQNKFNPFFLNLVISTPTPTLPALRI